MHTVNIHEAKTQLSRLVDQAVAGNPFIIAKAGKPMVKVVSLAPVKLHRLGFMAGQLTVPDNFNQIAQKEIEALFGGDQ